MQTVIRHKYKGHFRSFEWCVTPNCRGHGPDPLELNSKLDTNVHRLSSKCLVISGGSITAVYLTGLLSPSFLLSPAARPCSGTPLWFLSPHERTTAQRVNPAYGASPSRHLRANYCTWRGTVYDVDDSVSRPLPGCSARTSSGWVTS